MEEALLDILALFNGRLLSLDERIHRVLEVLQTRAERRVVRGQ
jgi:hypothetical protein